MAWDWDKLKQKQQRPGGGGGPNMDEVIQKFKQFNKPGAWVIVLIIAAVYLGSSAFFTV